MLQRLLSLCFILTLSFLAACSTQQVDDAEGDFSIDELRQRANYANEAGAYGDALYDYTQILAKEPDNIQALLGAGDTLLTIGKAKRAETYYVRALALQPNNVDARKGRALSWLMSGNYAAARTSFLNLVDEGVEDWQVWNGLGIISDLFGEYSNSVSYYKKAIALAPRRSMLKNNLGYSLLMNRDYGQAEDILAKAHKSAPANKRIVNNLAMAIAWQGNYDEAIKKLQLIMDEASAYNNVGYVAYLAENYEDAEEMFRKAIRLKPTYYRRAAENLELVLSKKN